MKYFTLFSLFISLGAMASGSRSHKEIPATVRVQGIACIIQVGATNVPASERTFTVLGGVLEGDLMIIRPEAGAIELKHKSASVKGCNLKKLDKISEDSVMYYGFIHGRAKITKEISPSRLDGNQECIANFTETLELDLGRGIILKSVETEFRQANDCSK